MITVRKSNTMQRFGWIDVIRLLVTGCLFSLSQNTWATEAPERLFWDKEPLSITLSVDQERLVTFPSGVRVGIPADLTSKLRTQNNAGTLYFKALEAFEPHRIEVREIEGPGIYLIDLSAVSNQHLNTAPVEIQLKQTHPESHTQSQRTKRSVRNHKRPVQLGLVTLTRFAAQQLYAPSRLLKQPLGIHRVSCHKKPLPHLLAGVQVMAKPVACWRGGSLYVTALSLSNQSESPITLDPRRLRGHFRAATFHHNRLLGRGSEADSTTLYVVSDRPFHEAL